MATDKNLDIMDLKQLRNEKSDLTKTMLAVGIVVGLLLHRRRRN